MTLIIAVLALLFAVSALVLSVAALFMRHEHVRLDHIWEVRERW